MKLSREEVESFLRIPAPGHVPLFTKDTVQDLAETCFALMDYRQKCEAIAESVIEGDTYEQSRDALYSYVFEQMPKLGEGWWDND